MVLTEREQPQAWILLGVGHEREIDAPVLHALGQRPTGGDVEFQPERRMVPTQQIDQFGRQPTAKFSGTPSRIVPRTASCVPDRSRI